MKNKNKGENMKNRTLKLVKGNIIYKNKYPLVRVQKIEQDINKFAYMIFTINASSTEPDNFEPLIELMASACFIPTPAPIITELIFI